MCEVGADWLPPARIQCHKGRIRVGDRNYLSASEALTVYLKQFDKEHQHATGWNPLSNTTMKDASLHSGPLSGDSSVSLGIVRPAMTTPVLNDSPVSISGTGLNTTHEFSHVNEEFLSQRGARQSVKFAGLGHAGSSQQRCVIPPDMACSPTHPGQTLSAMNGIFQHGSVPSFDPRQRTSIIPHQHCDPSSTSVYELQESWPTGSYYCNSSHKHSCALTGSGLPALNGLTNAGHDNGVTDYLDFHCAAGSAALGDRRNKTEAALVLTAMPTQRELKDLAEDAVREVKMKRLLKMVKPTASPRKHGEKGAVLNEATGERSRKAASEEKNRQVKDALKEAGHRESSHNLGPPSALQQEVEEALSRSAQLLDDLKSSQHVRRPALACDVNSHHSADILLSSTTTSADPQPPSRASRSRHRYSYRTQPVRARSLSLDGGLRRPEPQSSADTSCSDWNDPKSRSLADCQKFRSMDNLKTSVDDIQPPRSMERLKPPVADTQRYPSRDNPQPTSCDHPQQIRRLENQKTRSAADVLRPVDSLKPSVIDDTLSSVEGLIPPLTVLSDRELQYLRKGTSVLSDCEDLLRQLQAVNPPSLPDISFYKRKNWSTQSTGQTEFSTPNPENIHLTYANKAEKDRMDTSAEPVNLEVGTLIRGESPSGMNGLKPLNKLFNTNTQEFCSDNTIPVMGLSRAGSVPCVNTFGRDIETTIDDSSMADFSYVGPGLSFSDLTTTPAGSKRLTPANTLADRPPRSPHRLSTTKSDPCKDSEAKANTTATNSAPGRNLTTSNPVLQDLADILDTIDMNPTQTETTLTSPPEAPSFQPPSHKQASAACGGTERLQMCLSDLAEGRGIRAAVNEEGHEEHRSALPPEPEGHNLPSRPFSISLDSSSSTEAPLDTVEHCTHAGQTTEEKEKDEAAELLPALKGYRFEREPGGQSLEKALLHLGRLKSLVQTPPAQHTTPAASRSRSPHPATNASF